MQIDRLKSIYEWQVYEIVDGIYVEFVRGKHATFHRSQSSKINPVFDYGIKNHFKFQEKIEWIYRAFHGTQFELINLGVGFGSTNAKLEN